MLIITNSGLTQQEEVENRKHGPFYASIEFVFLPFVKSCFGSFGPTAARFHFIPGPLYPGQLDISAI